MMEEHPSAPALIQSSETRPSIGSAPETSSSSLAGLPPGLIERLEEIAANQDAMGGAGYMLREDRAVLRDAANALTLLSSSLVETQNEAQENWQSVKKWHSTATKQAEEISSLSSSLVGMRGERDSEREIAQGWERKCEAFEASLVEVTTRYEELLTRIGHPDEVPTVAVPHSPAEKA